MVVTEGDNITVSKAEHPANAHVPIVVILFGMVTEVRDLQL